MALNKFMHPRNIYKSKKPDFQQLALKYDYFKEKVTVNLSGIVILDFKDPSALRALTRAILQEDFSLLVELPLDRLIPTVPQRLNYIHWLEDIIGAKTNANGIDIGTGASCIYPLLGCRLNGWKFLASDIDDQNLMFAQDNVKRNNMQDKIKVQKVAETTMLQGLVEEGENYDFCMCNPPFFTDHLEAQGISNTRNVDRSDPHSVSTACESESTAWGGEVRFVIHMIDESLVLKDRIRVYTSMLGKKTSVQLLKDYLQKKQISNYSTTEFCQGRTMRWAIAWSFLSSVEFPKSAFKQLKNTKPPLTCIVPRTEGVVSDYTVQAYTQYIRKTLELLKINYHVKHSGKFYSCFLIQALENTWSHQRRKRREKRLSADNSMSDVSLVAETVAAETSQDLKVSDKSETEAFSGIKSSCTTIHDCDNKIDSKKGKQVSDDSDREVLKRKHDDKGTKPPEGTDSGTGDDKGTETPAGSNSGPDDQSVRAEKCDSPPPSKKVKRDNTNLEDTDTDMKSDVANDDNGKCPDSNTDEKTQVRSTLNEDIKINPGNKEFLKFKDKLDKSRAKFIQEQAQCVLNDSGIVEDKCETKVEKSDDTPAPIVRKDVVKQFWEEMEGRQKEQGNEKGVRPRSEFDKVDPFTDTEPCLVLAKLVVRKDEGVISMIMTYTTGNKEAMHQIFQFFKNKVAVGK